MSGFYKEGSKKVIDRRRKITRVGGSVMVPIPREIRLDVGIGVGDYVLISEGPEGEIIIKKERKAWDGRVARKN